MVEDISILELENAVREIAAQEPDFVYTRAVIDNVDNTACIYFDTDGCPSCLIGQGLSKLGVTRGDLEELENGANFMAIGELLGFSHGADSMRWLSDVQFFQDSGYSWGSAVERADAKKSQR
jgi:hypothetical protein